MITPRGGAKAATLMNVEEYRATMRENAAKHLEALVQEHEVPDLAIGGRVIEGNPSDAIVDLAERDDFDLIVIATHGHSGWRRFLFGSVADKVVRTATRPVLTVGPPSRD
jgi:nucleotide-binding universal stress UspA family protein